MGPMSPDDNLKMLLLLDQHLVTNMPAIFVYILLLSHLQTAYMDNLGNVFTLLYFLFYLFSIFFIPPILFLPHQIEFNANKLDAQIRESTRLVLLNELNPEQHQWLQMSFY